MLATHARAAPRPVLSLSSAARVGTRVAPAQWSEPGRPGGTAVRLPRFESDRPLAMSAILGRAARSLKPRLRAAPTRFRLGRRKLGRHRSSETKGGTLALRS